MGTQAGAFRFLNVLDLVKLAVSLGRTESTGRAPGTMTHGDVASEDRERMGICASMVRLSVGVEDYEDIIADVEQTLGAV